MRSDRTWRPSPAGRERPQWRRALAHPRGAGAYLNGVGFAAGRMFAATGGGRLYREGGRGFELIELPVKQARLQRFLDLDSTARRLRLLMITNNNGVLLLATGAGEEALALPVERTGGAQLALRHCPYRHRRSRPRRRARLCARRAPARSRRSPREAALMGAHRSRRPPGSRAGPCVLPLRSRRRPLHRRRCRCVPRAARRARERRAGRSRSGVPRRHTGAASGESSPRALVRAAWGIEQAPRGTERNDGTAGVAAACCRLASQRVALATAHGSGRRSTRCIRLVLGARATLAQLRPGTGLATQSRVSHRHQGELHAAAIRVVFSFTTAHAGRARPSCGSGTRRKCMRSSTTRRTAGCGARHAMDCSRAMHADCGRAKSRFRVAPCTT